MTKKLEGKTAVITGGTEGIGFATARLFVEEGAYVFITGRRQKELDEAARTMGANVFGVQGDVANLGALSLHERLQMRSSRYTVNLGVRSAVCRSNKLASASATATRIRCAFRGDTDVGMR